jgi:membrane protein YdbS with pleckstrin-like domain
VDAEERVIWTGRPSWRARMSLLASGAVIAILLLAAALWIGWEGIGATIFLIAVVVTMGWALIQTILWKYTVTDRRIFVRHGLLSVTEETARLGRVQDITLRQSIFDRLFGVGTLSIDTAGTEGGALDLRGLRNPTGVRELVENAVRAATGRDDL